MSSCESPDRRGGARCCRPTRTSRSTPSTAGTCRRSCSPTTRSTSWSTPASGTTPASATGPCRRARRSWPTGSPSKGDVQRHNDYVHYEHDGIAKILRKPLIGAVAARLAQARRDPDLPVHADLQAADRGRAVEHRALALRQALLVVLVVGADADRVHPVPRLPAGDGHDHDGRRQPPVEGDRRRRHHRPALRRAGPRRSWTQMLAENAAYNGAEVVKVPITIPQGPHELPPLPHLPRQRRERQRPARAGRSRCTCRTATTPTASSRSPTAPRRRTTTTSLVRRTADGRPDYADPEYCPTLWADR